MIAEHFGSGKHGASSLLCIRLGNRIGSVRQPRPGSRLPRATSRSVMWR